jgi:hypothetical protein
MGGLFSKSRARKKLEKKRAEEGHYTEKGRPGGSEQYTGMKPAGGGAKTPMTRGG